MRILLIEDVADLAHAISQGLVKAGFTIDVAGSVEAAFAAADSMSYDAIILDLRLPDGSGLTCLRTWRQQGKSTPILIVTALDGIDDRVRGLDLGADDYLLKPFEMPELLARLRAVLRRPGATLGAVLECNNLNFDTVARNTIVGGIAIALSRRETDLLEQLLRRVGRVVPKSAIEERLYGLDDEGSANSVEVLLSRLRKKLQLAGAESVIHTIRGVGYMMAGPEN